MHSFSLHDAFSLCSKYVHYHKQNEGEEVLTFKQTVLLTNDPLLKSRRCISVSGTNIIGSVKTRQNGFACLRWMDSLFKWIERPLTALLCSLLMVIFY